MNEHFVLRHARPAVLIAVLAFARHARSQDVIVAMDDASQPAYSNGWQAGDNGGFGFLAWEFDGFFEPDFSPRPEAQFVATNGFVDIPENGPAFGQTNGNRPYWGYTAWAIRPFATPLQIGETFSVDLALFYNEYDRLRGLTDNLAAPQSLPVLIDNVGAGRSHGAELSSHWQWQSNIKWLLSYRYFDLDIKADADSRDQTIADANANDPSHQLKARLDWDISEHWALFVAARWVGELKDQNVDAYAAVDANVMWQLSDQLEVSLRASNLTDDAHPEFGQDTEIRRSVHAQLTWTF